MDQEGLKNFFVMHGKNIDRMSGRAGRGRFGTGKSAAFGIANKLAVSSIRDGLRNRVELTRADIDAAGEREIPVRHTQIDQETDDDNGTTVTISAINLRKLDSQAVISFVERHLRHWSGRPTVIVNNHECEFNEPPVAESRRLQPDNQVVDHLGDAELLLKVSKGPLDRELQGVSISANGVWLQTTLAGAEGQPMSNFIFGEIDVPALDDEDTPVPAFDMSRSMELNQSNETVKALFAFVGREVDKLRRELVRRERSKRDEEETKRLEREATLIARIINEDFQDFSHRVARVKSKAGRGRDAGSNMRDGNDNDDVLIQGDAIAAEVDTHEEDVEHKGGTKNDKSEPPQKKSGLRANDDGQSRGDPAGGTGSKRRPQGGFSVKFRPMGNESTRATYSAEERTIFINLEHPQIVAAIGAGGTEDPVFRRLAYEVAFSEYSIALANELANRDEYVDPFDPIFDIRDTINRMARRAASLYRN